MKNVLITGSSHGIGAAAAIAFAKEGYNVGVNANKNPQGAEQVAAECRKYGVEAEVFVCDVSKHDMCKEMIEKFIERFGSIDVLVNNAGGALQIPGGPDGEFKDMPMEYWDSQIALNLSSAAYCARYAAADMIKKGTQGSIINISSIHSEVTWVHRRMLPYSAGKGGLNMFTKALGVELIKYGINVNGIAPGLVFTKLAERYSQEDLASFSRKIPYGNGGMANDIVPMILFLADKEKSKFIVGQTIFIDGGQSIDGSIESMNFKF
ncbi:MAG: SDR family oxidoreductase [Lachnospiraceae bacterium]|nr:SDR family oxidoreductase [Lachnospiraceae bacterium]